MQFNFYANDRYSTNLEEALKLARKKGTAGGLALGFTCLVQYCVDGILIWYGIKLVREGYFDAGKMYSVSLYPSYYF